MKSRFNYMYKFEHESKWRDISEDFLKILIKEFFADEDFEEKIRDIRCGHPLKISEATIEAWPLDKEN